MEPIAVIGLGCRFPGAKNPQAFWDLLKNGVDAITEVPADRWNVNDLYDPERKTPGKMTTRYGGFLEQVDQFDASFFGISPREARHMDPQQRLLMEVAWEALEDAGQVADRLAGSSTGVFIGISCDDYGRMNMKDLNQSDSYVPTGSAFSIAANRISYFFDFRGPSVAVDTACSSSLVAAHLACRSLRDGESSLALCGGVNLLLHPALTINFSKAGFMSPDGRCKAFDASANGYVRAEGAGIVVLKTLSDALRDKDYIYAVIRGSAVNQDGRSNGLTAPNGLAQQAVLKEAYRLAGVSPGQIQYVEAHGTGTNLGDPIEVRALGAVLSEDRVPGQVCLIGSVKSNFGHLEAAAGIAGLMKLCLCLKHKAIPPSLHFVEPNPHIPFDQLPLKVQSVLGDWPGYGQPIIAGVSSFGFGGTNAHVVVEEAPTSDVNSGRSGASEEIQVLPLSAKSAEALNAVASSLLDFLSSNSESLQNISYSSSVRRSHHDFRLALIAKTSSEACAILRAYVQENDTTKIHIGRKNYRCRLYYLFSEYKPCRNPQLLDLLQQEPSFSSTMEKCDRLIQEYFGASVISELISGNGSLEEHDLMAPTLLALHLSSAAVWQSWGIMPAGMLGSGAGQLAAACAAGALSLTDAFSFLGRLKQFMTGAKSESDFTERLRLNWGPDKVPVMCAITGEAIEEIAPKQLLIDPERSPSTSMFTNNGNVILHMSPPEVRNASIEDACIISAAGDRSEMLDSLAKLYSMGVNPNWSALHPQSARHISLPSYPWQRQQYWLENDNTRELQ